MLRDGRAACRSARRTPSAAGPAPRWGTGSTRRPVATPRRTPSRCAEEPMPEAAKRISPACRAPSRKPERLSGMGRVHEQRMRRERDQGDVGEVVQRAVARVRVDVRRDAVRAAVADDQRVPVWGGLGDRGGADRGAGALPGSRPRPAGQAGCRASPRPGVRVSRLYRRPHRPQRGGSSASASCRARSAAPAPARAARACRAGPPGAPSAMFFPASPFYSAPSGAFSLTPGTRMPAGRPFPVSPCQARR